MHLAVEFPSVAYRWGASAVPDLARAVEEAGYDEIDMFDHITMGHPKDGRPQGPYPAQMPLLEAFITLGAIAVVTRRVRLGTEVLVLPQRQPTLVAKQVATLDILSGGRVRLGAGVGWQASEYESLGVPFAERGRRMDECIELLRLYWREPSVTFTGRYYQAEAMAMDPKPVQPGGPPIWLGGSSDAALTRIGRMGDGWLAGGGERIEGIKDRLAVIHRAAEQAGRDPAMIGLQIQLGDVRDLEALAARAATFREVGFTWGAVNMTQLYTAGARDLAAQREALARIRERVQQEAG
ncbi:MAG: LLM class F420-dependent oxidoreductase [Dehalococcoidia bacterium]